MRRMRKIRLLIIIISLAVIACVGALAIVYYTTDIFKSNKALFKKYASKVDIDSFIDVKELSSYAKRMKTEPSSSEGDIAITISGKEEESTTIDEKIEYNLITNPQAKKSSAKIKYSQEDGKALPMNYYRNGDLYGIQFEDIIKEYVAFENKDIKKFAKKIGVKDVEDIPDKIQIFESDENSNVNLNTDELYEIINKYIKIAADEIPDKNYTKLKKEQITVDGKTIEAEGYNVEIKSNELISILEKCKETIKKDQKVYKYLNSLNLEKELSFEEYQELVEENSVYIEDLKTEMQMKLNISVYKQGNKLVKLYAILENEQGNGKSKIEFSVENNKTIEINCVLNTENISSTPFDFEFNIKITKDKSNGQEDGFKISINGKQNNKNIAKTDIVFAKYGKSNSQSVKINTSINAELDNMNIKAVINNNSKFNTNEEIKEVDKSNIMVINDYEAEQIGNLIVNLSDLISEKIDMQKTLIGSYISVYKAAVNSSKSAAENTKKIQAREAISLTKANIIAEYYGEEITDVATGLIQQQIRSNLEGGELQGANVSVTATSEPGKYKIEIAGVELQDEDKIMDLSVLNVENVENVEEPQ